MPGGPSLRTLAIRGLAALAVLAVAYLAGTSGGGDGAGGDRLGDGGVITRDEDRDAGADRDRGQAGSQGGGARSRDDGAAPLPAPGEPQRATVERVIDGDTLVARVGGAGGGTHRVRLLGIDAPETSTLRSGSTECGGREATSAAEALARRWPEVELRTDPSQATTDRYDRLLAYVDVPGRAGVSFQRELLGQGWVKVYTLAGRPIDRGRAFEQAAEEARSAGRGVWRACGGDFRRPLR